jgi:hypothetical protein
MVSAQVWRLYRYRHRRHYVPFLTLSCRTHSRTVSWHNRTMISREVGRQPSPPPRARRPLCQGCSPLTACALQPRQGRCRPLSGPVPRFCGPRARRGGRCLGRGLAPRVFTQGCHARAWRSPTVPPRMRSRLDTSALDREHPTQALRLHCSMAWAFSARQGAGPPHRSRAVVARRQRAGRTRPRTSCARSAAWQQHPCATPCRAATVG